MSSQIYISRKSVVDDRALKRQIMGVMNDTNNINDDSEYNSRAVYPNNTVNRDRLTL